ncbi:MSP7-like protein [Plasmodium vinckei brucechwatti]|uniref:MSP7-like protein n=1 Tax=Plasmodium vinckei brucechwatti TaxID=119398 RepID=A0A6V7SSA8_PLAVN|nr:MSP7-like protein [Plasmodium vinckei brucechwatti]
MAAYKKLYFLAILALFFKAVSADNFSNNDDNADDENVSDVINIFKNKNHDLYNNPNYISDIKKKFQLLKKQIDQMNKYEKGMTSGEIGNILEEEAEEESDEESNADKIVFGMNEDDLDNYDDDFWGQGAKKVTPVQKDDDASGAAVVEGNADPAPSPGTGGTEGSQGTEVTGGTGGSKGAEVTQVTEGTGGNKGSQEPQGPQAPQVNSGVQGAAGSVVPAAEFAPGKTAFLGTAFDEMLKEQKHDTKVHNTEYHSKYNALKTECDFAMNIEEYEIAKKLISTYFSGTTENPIYLYDILIKAITNEEYKKHFKNFIYGIYSFAKKYNYLSKTRLAEENSQYIRNVLNVLATVDLK